MSRRKRSQSRQRKRSPQPKEDSAQLDFDGVNFDGALQLHLRGRLAEAETAYRGLLRVNPRDARIFHLLGRLLRQQGKHDEAIDSIRSSLVIDPDGRQAMNDLGLLYHETGALDEAVVCFSRLIETDAQDVMAINNLGIVLKDQDRLSEAVDAFRKAAALDPNHADARYNLGNILKNLDDLAGAESAYRAALVIRPTMLDVYPNLAAVLRRLGKLDEASDVLSQWLEYEPDNPIARHMRATGSQHDTPLRASEEYVQQVFDEFAETFDQHLQKLDYRGPRLIAEALRANNCTSKAAFDILDAGCGTGLCAEVLQPLARTLVGVDLSSKMLAKARELEIYDRLVESDLVTYLNSHRSAFDVIVSADTFGYFGDLQPAFAAVRHSLTDGGFLVCTVEIDDQNDAHAEGAEDRAVGYQLMKSGRYRHSESYLVSTLVACGLHVHSLTMGVLRVEASQPAKCMVVCTVAKA